MPYCLLGDTASPHPTLKLKFRPLSAVHYCIVSITATALHTWRSFLRPQPRKSHSALMGTHLSPRHLYNRTEQNPSHLYVTNTVSSVDILMHSAEICGAGGLISYHSLLYFLIILCLQMSGLCTGYCCMQRLLVPWATTGLSRGLRRTVVHEVQAKLHT